MIWTSTTAGTKTRYAVFRPTTKAADPKVYAHKWIYEQEHGPVPEGLELDHVCKRRLCVNKEHLEPVTSAENSRRTRLDMCRAEKHDLTDPSNVRWDSKGRRRGCYRCWLDRAAERRAGNGGQ